MSAPPVGGRGRFPPLPGRPKQRRERALRRGDLVDCEACGHVFILQASTGAACRRCHSQRLAHYVQRNVGNRR